MVDLKSEGKINSYGELQKMHSLKTAALIKCALVLGYLAATDTPSEQVIKDLELYGENVGIAFQIKDDILDVTSTEEELGKPIGSDEEQGKIPFLTFMSADQALDYARDLTEQAKNSIALFPARTVLCDLADYLLNRTH